VTLGKDKIDQTDSFICLSSKIGKARGRSEDIKSGIVKPHSVISH